MSNPDEMLQVLDSNNKEWLLQNLDSLQLNQTFIAMIRQHLSVVLSYDDFKREKENIFDLLRLMEQITTNDIRYIKNQLKEN